MISEKDNISLWKWTLENVDFTNTLTKFMTVEDETCLVGLFAKLKYVGCWAHVVKSSFYQQYLQNGVISRKRHFPMK